MSYRLKVRIVSGSRLRAADVTGKSDPYVQAFVLQPSADDADAGVDLAKGQPEVAEKDLADLGAPLFTTPVCKQTLDPTWAKAEGTFEVALPRGAWLELRLWDEDALSADDFLGYCRIGPPQRFGAAGSSSSSVTKTYCTVQGRASNLRKSRCTGLLRVDVEALPFGEEEEEELPRFPGECGRKLQWGAQRVPAAGEMEALVVEQRSVNPPSGLPRYSPRARDALGCCLRGVAHAWAVAFLDHGKAIARSNRTGEDSLGLALVMCQSRLKDADALASELEAAERGGPKHPEEVVRGFARLCEESQRKGLWVNTDDTLLDMIREFEAYLKSVRATVLGSLDGSAQAASAAAAAAKAKADEAKAAAKAAAQKERDARARMAHVEKTPVKKQTGLFSGLDIGTVRLDPRAWGRFCGVDAADGSLIVGCGNATTKEPVISDSDGGSLFWLDPATGEVRKAVKIQGADPDSTMTHAAVLPDGDLLVCQRRNNRVLRASPDGATTRWTRDLGNNFQPSGVALADAAGTRCFVSCFAEDVIVSLDTATGESAGEPLKQDCCEHLLSDPARDTLIAHDGDLHPFVISTGAKLKKAPAETQEGHTYADISKVKTGGTEGGLACDWENDFLFVGGEMDNLVQVIDLRDNCTVVGSIRFKDGSAMVTDLAFDPKSRTLHVLGTDGGGPLKRGTWVVHNVPARDDAAAGASAGAAAAAAAAGAAEDGKAEEKEEAAAAAAADAPPANAAEVMAKLDAAEPKSLCFTGRDKKFVYYFIRFGDHKYYRQATNHSGGSRSGVTCDDADEFQHTLAMNLGDKPNGTFVPTTDVEDANVRGSLEKYEG